jgi:hypothetical protein
MSTRLPIDDGEPFISQLEKAMKAMDADLVEANLPKLEDLIALYQDRIFELAKLQARAREIRDRHERPATKRIRKTERGGL